MHDLNRVNSLTGEKGNRCESCTNSSPYFASFESNCHWETGKADLKHLSNEPGYLPFTVQEHISSSHEELAVRNT